MAKLRTGGVAWEGTDVSSKCSQVGCILSRTVHVPHTAVNLSEDCLEVVESESGYV